LFNIVFELDNVVDFVTTGLWKTFETGTLPIYYGAPNINDLVPPKSIISWHDFNDTVALANHLTRVMTDKELYNSYHEWRKPPLSDKFVSLYNFTHTHSTCRLCRWSYAKLHGFAWDHTKQQVSDVTISRKLCYGYNLLITHPFRESWVNGAEMLRFSENPGQGQCHDTSVHSSTRVGSWTRTLWFHDGVTDILLEGSGDPVTYQIVTPLLESHLETKVAAHHFEIQGDSFRYTILTSWSAANPQFTNGVLNFELGFEKELRLRIITDEVDSFYPKSNQETSYFESIMIKDFFAPIEKFLVN